MTRWTGLLFAIGGLALPSFAGCGTKDVGPDQMVADGQQTGADQGALLLAFASTDATYDAEQARLRANPSTIPYHVYMDGKRLVIDDAGQPNPVDIGEGGQATGGFVAAGPHHFAVAADGRPAIFAGDTEVAAGTVTRIYLFGTPLGTSNAVQGRFVTDPLAPATGIEHVSAINLVREGLNIEVVSCSDAANCTAVSPPLALGDVYQADFPAPTDPNAFSDSGAHSLSDAGAGIGYRGLGMAAPPGPPVLPLLRATFFWAPTGAPPGPPANFVASPIFMSFDGTLLASFD
jgi:hypothetical protein